MFELDPEVKQFLQTGQLIVKHSKSALPAAKHLYVSQNLQHLVWNKALAEIEPKNSMLVTSVYAAIRGQTTPQLQRVRFKRKLAGHEEHCFSIFGLAEDGRERTVDVQCKSLSEREKWVVAIEQLIKWTRTRKLYGQRTLTMMTTTKVEKETKKEEAGAASSDQAHAQPATKK